MMYDYCIIGSGIGGGVLAVKLAQNSNKKILLIEAGGYKSNNNVTIENVGLPFGLRATTSIELGGTSNLWHGVLSKLDPIDFKKRDWVKNSGWPISLEELEPFYEEAAKIFNVQNYSFFEKQNLTKTLSKKLKDIKFDDKELKNKLFQQPLPALRLKSVLLEKKYKNLNILFNTTALELVSKDKVEKLLVGRENNEIEEIYSKEFIICTGALETPRLLLNSNLNNINIGRYLMDHPMGNLCQLEFKKPHKAHLYSDMKYHAKNKIKTGLVFSEQTQSAKKLLNHNFYLRPSFKKGISDESEKIKLVFLTFLSGKIYLKDIFKLLGNLNVIRQILAYKLTLNFTYKYADAFFVTEQVPNENSSVTLSKKVDKWNYPISKVNWQLKKQDLDSMVSSFKVLSEDAFPKSDFNFIHDQNDLNWADTFTSAAHHVGTARMGKNAREGVVDKNLKVHGVNNLYICDGSVFPTSGNVNSGFTIAALACKLANYLQK